MQKFDVIVIGAGPAGYVAAIRCAQLGLQTVCVDMWQDQAGQPSPGGTCLNVGCIPSKALLESSEQYERACHDMAQHGINTGEVSLDLAVMMQRKQQVVRDLTSGVNALFAAYKVTLVSGRGRLLADKVVEVTDPAGAKSRLQAESVILAPGSLPRSNPSLPVTEDFIVDSTGALAFSEVPDTLAIIGAGVIGLELGSVWRRLGTKVSLIELAPTLLPMADEHIARQALQVFSKQGLAFCFGSTVEGYKIKDQKVYLHYQDSDGEHTAAFDKVIVAMGRIPNTDALLSEESGLVLDEYGRIPVDAECRTTVPGVYAIGDAVRGPMLAHKGSEEGMMVAELIAGHYARVNYDVVPFVIYTDPEVAWCGKTEQQLREAGQDYRAGQFPFAANGRARASGQLQGSVKILADANTDRVLGVHIIGPHASELIAQAVIAMEFGSSSEDLAMTVFAHPSLSEAFHEAALDVAQRAIHKARAVKR